jgi:hypothetical protein
MLVDLPDDEVMPFPSHVAFVAALAAGIGVGTYKVMLHIQNASGGCRGLWSRGLVPHRIALIYPDIPPHDCEVTAGA